MAFCCKQLERRDREMKIAFLWDWYNNSYQTITWKDGLAAALRELIKRGHEVKVITCGNDMVIDHEYFPITVTSNVIDTVDLFHPDVILHWGDFTRPHAKPLSELGIPMAICFAGGEPINDNTPYFKHIFVESKVYLDRLNDEGYDNVSIAFGTNTELFTPFDNVKQFDVIFPATFALWKRHGLYAQSVQGMRSLAVGYMYADHEQECWKDCIRYGVTILPHVSAETLRYLYASSKSCVVTSESGGGSQRTVLEAMAMNVPLVVTDSDKFDYITDEVEKVEPTKEAIREATEKQICMIVNTREHVLNNWSERNYADELEKRLNSII